MKKHIIFILFIAFTSVLFAQQNKQFTLDELIPGGKNFYNYYPRILEQFQWHGDELVMLRHDSVFRVNPLSPDKKKLAFRFNEILKNGNERNGNVSNVSFDREGGDNLIFSTPDGMGVYDLKTGRVISSIGFPKNSANREFSPGHAYLAYTKDNNLYITDGTGKETAISSEKNKGIVCGRAVHRDEFGIKGGIFWSPNGNKLAFYRMDETMVADYPIVDISTRIATEKSIKYPMAGEKSHEVTIGVYDIKTGQTVYLKTGEPREKYLTNVAWSPDGKFIYVAELNREQNHLKMNRYDAGSGDWDKTLFEETHPKYVEPENPVLFVKNNPNQFIWQSERDGFNHLYLYDVSGKLLKQLT
ncbi:MAG: DPP IV N-terminal domain-containing protein, partial [Petrimonas sp.]|nr:DPP IV N-terminal domain-containing protein [Petrimonas sp.]